MNSLRFRTYNLSTSLVCTAANWLYNATTIALLNCLDLFVQLSLINLPRLSLSFN